MIRKIATTFTLLAAMALGACDPLPTLDIASQVNLNTEAGILSGYGIVVNAENALKALPLCLTGTVPSITNICAKRSVINRLQNADKTMNTSINTLVAFVKNNPSASPSQYISTAQNALLAVQTILNSAKSGS